VAAAGRGAHLAAAAAAPHHPRPGPLCGPDFERRNSRPNGNNLSTDAIDSAANKRSLTGENNDDSNQMFVWMLRRQVQVEPASVCVCLAGLHAAAVAVASPQTAGRPAPVPKAHKILSAAPKFQRGPRRLKKC
jgi:hypothetical protein